MYVNFVSICLPQFFIVSIYWKAYSLTFDDFGKLQYNIAE